jgi:hypothetical protein
MREVYSYADQVTIWLGEADPYTEEFVRIITGAGVPFPFDIRNTELYSEYMIQNTQLRLMFRIILFRPWWRRIWTVQECVLPRNDPVFLCGTYSFAWSEFFAALDDVYSIDNGFEEDPETHSSLKSICQYMRHVMDQRGMNGSDFEFQYIAAAMLDKVRQIYQETDGALRASICFPTCVGRQATMPHDYVFGTVSLMTEQERCAIQVDYTKPVWEVYREFMHRLLLNETTSALHLLSLTPFVKETDYPSWIPDLSAQNNVSKHTGRLLASDTCFEKHEGVRLSEDGDVLMLQGIIVDTVAEVHLMAEDSPELRKDFCRLRDARTIPEAGKDYPPSAVVAASKRELAYRLFTANCLHRSLRSVDSRLLNFCWDVATDTDKKDLWRSDSTWGLEPLDHHPTLTLKSVMHQLLQCSISTCRGKKLIHTESGIRGIAVPNTEVGDVIVCIYGFSNALVLRPRKNHYIIIGAVYLAGLMDWTVLSICLQEGLLTEATFRIR